MVCDADCQLVPGDAQICGDGSINSNLGEACDDGNTTNDGSIKPSSATDSRAEGIGICRGSARNVSELNCSNSNWFSA